MSKAATMEVRWALEQWGRWAHHKRGVQLGYPSQTAFRRLLGSSIAEPQISDELGCYLDGLVSALSQEHPREATAIALRYVSGLTHRKVAGALKCSQKGAQGLLERGEFWIEGRMGGD